MKKRILIIDDDVELCDEMAELLRCEGYAVDNTSNSGRGLALINTTIYDSIIIDFKMPGLNGFELLKRIKKNRHGTPVLLVSGRPFIEKLLKEEKLSRLVDEIITKPFDARTILKKVAHAVRERRRDTPVATPMKPARR